MSALPADIRDGPFVHSSAIATSSQRQTKGQVPSDAWRSLMKCTLPYIIRSSVIGTIVLLALLFIPTGTLNYWQGWACVAVATIASGAYTVYLAKYDPALFKRRTGAGITHEKEPAQKVIILFLLIAFAAQLVLPPLDVRFGWSSVPWYISVFGDALIVVSFYVFLSRVKSKHIRSGEHSCRRRTKSYIYRPKRTCTSSYVFRRPLSGRRYATRARLVVDAASHTALPAHSLFPDRKRRESAPARPAGIRGVQKQSPLSSHSLHLVVI
jgi:hypothetical protein